METFECITTRRSVRNYEKKDVPKELIGKVLYAGHCAPSAGNTVPWEFIIVKNRDVKKKLAMAALRQQHVLEAPVIIAVLANVKKSEERYGERGRDLYSIQDTAIAIENMMLTAHDAGLGTCWIGAFEEEAVKDLLKVPGHMRCVALITLGFPVPYQKPRDRPRAQFEHLTYVNEYGKGHGWIEKFGAEWKVKITPLSKHLGNLKKTLTEE